MEKRKGKENEKRRERRKRRGKGKGEEKGIQVGEGCLLALRRNGCPCRKLTKNKTTTKTFASQRIDPVM